MSKAGKPLLGALALAVLVVAAGSRGHAAIEPTVDSGSWDPRPAARELLDLTVDPEPEGGVRVALDLEGPVGVESFALTGPDRLVLDLPGVVDRLSDHRFDVGRAGVVRVRTAQHRTEPDPVTRVVFDLEAPRLYTIEAAPDGVVVRFDPSVAARYTETSSGTGDFVPVAAEALLPAAPAGRPALEVDDLVAELEARAAETDEPPPAVEPTATRHEPPSGGRAVEPDLIDRLLRMPSLASPQPDEPGDPESAAEAAPSFETRRIVADGPVYTGRRISLNLVDADIAQVFRLFHEISGLNFVLDPSVSGRVTIAVDEVPWDQALDIILKNNNLDKVLEGNVVRIAPTEKLAREAAARKQLKEAQELEAEPVTITRTLSYAKAGDVEQVIRDSGVLTARGKVIVDDRTNTLIISDIPTKVTPLDALISTLDAETPQVMIEARVVETTREFTQELGVDWGFNAIADASLGTSTNLEFPHNASVRYGLNLPGEGQASDLSFSFGNVIDSFTLDVALHTLETEGSARVLSSPKIATQNNERAEIEQGVRIPIVNTTATEIDVEFVSASLRMVVTPQITAEGTIILDVVVENNSPNFSQTAGGIPSIQTQRAQTKVLISDGGTTVIGGIFTVNEGQSEVGVPWFRKLPVFGWLFKQRSIDNRNQELLIFITPKIMRIT
jgi:type IV pilus assembly protein PilQ